MDQEGSVGSFALQQYRYGMNHTKQTIAIIGASGQMGAALSKALARGPYRLLLKSGRQEALSHLVNAIQKDTPAAEVEGTTCPTDASWEADIIILAVPYAVEKEIAGRIREVANQKIVISISNPLNSSYDGLVTAPETSAAEELQLLLPHSKVVKAFNTTFAADFSQPLIGGQQADAFVAGNDEAAVQTVSELVATAGFRPIVAGALPVSRTLEAMQLLLIQLGMRYHYNWLAGWKVLHDPY